jgi:purine nucleosidase
VDDGAVGSRLEVVVDTDLALGVPGEKVDDGVALALALASPELDVTLVTTVAGNVDRLTATSRTVRLLDRLGRSDLPVVTGGGPAGAARAILDRVLADAGGVTILALGPLTTVAAALAAAGPALADLREVVAMGGRFSGAASEPAEFNTRTDPWAARSVVQSGVRLRFVGQDVTGRVALTAADLERLDGGGAAGRYLADQVRARLAVLGPDGVTGCPMHDPLAVVALTHPDLFTWQPAEVVVDLAGPTRGRTTWAPDDERAARLASCRIATGVDVRAATEVMLARLAGLP